MKNYLLTIVIVFAITQAVYSQTGKTPKFKIQIQLNNNGKDSTGLITITTKSRSFKTIKSKGNPIPIELNFNSYYLIKCTRPGYITKIVYIDTKVPDGREQKEFAKFNLFINLFEEDGKTKPSDKPVGGIKYNVKYEDFDEE
jgi:hypothetical protein